MYRPVSLHMMNDPKIELHSWLLSENTLNSSYISFQKVLAQVLSLSIDIVWVYTVHQLATMQCRRTLYRLLMSQILQSSRPSN